MDRKAWIVVTLCALLMGLNAWYVSKHSAHQAQVASEEAARKAAEAAKTPAPTATAPAVVTAGAPAVPGAPAAMVEETKELTAGNAKFVITNLGGGVKQAVLSGSDHVVINELGKDPIGALRRDVKTKDATIYKFVESTPKQVVLEGVTPDQLLIRKTFSLSEGEVRDDHLLKLQITVTNQGAVQHTSDQHYLYTGAAASLVPNDIVHPGVFWNDSGDADYHDTMWFGGGIFSSEKAEANLNLGQLRYGGVMSRFHVSLISLITKPTEEKPGRVWAERFLVDHSNDKFKDVSGATTDYGIHGTMSLPRLDIAPGGTQTIDYEVYLGPKEYHRLAKLGGQRTGIMFYGWTKPVSLIFVHLMRWLDNVVNSWGLAIILMTIIVRLATWPVFASSMKQAKRMGKLAPMMKELQEKYKDDQQRQSQEMMKLYKDYGFNPLGCVLPMIIQILIFSGFYRVLQVAAELRGQPFWWVNDLSLPDTVAQFIGFDVNPLPILMGLSTIVQMKMTPQAPSVDKSQQRMMMFMPIVFVFICYNFAAALALYYTTQNLFGIFQSWAMRKFSNDDEPLKKVAPLPKGPPPGPSPIFNPMGNKPKDKKTRTPRLGG